MKSAMLCALPGCGAQALRVIGHLDDIWPYPVEAWEERLMTVALACMAVKKLYPEAWEGILFLPPSEGAKIVLDIIIAKRSDANRLEVGYIP